MLGYLSPVFLPLGVLIALLGVAMLAPALVDYSAGHQEWEIFVLASAVTIFLGCGLALANRCRVGGLDIRQAFIFTLSAWLVLPAFAALPFYFCVPQIQYTDCFFEAMSGLSTTGATIFTGLEDMNDGLLLWRAILQWLGGIGIIVMALVILPMLKIGGFQLFRLESSQQSGKSMPKITQYALWICLIYLVFTLACIITYYAFSMSLFDAVTHAMTTIATGGFSTRDNSFAAFSDPRLKIAAIVFMCCGSFPFVLYVFAITGKPQALWNDSQIRTFLAIVIAALGILLVHEWRTSGQIIAVLDKAFNVVSVITGTGYASSDYAHHDYAGGGGVASVVFFLLMFIGGCAGSTSCGIKIFRLQILTSMVVTHLKQICYPHGVFTPWYQNRPVQADICASVLTFFFLFILCVVILALFLAMTGLDFITSISAALTALANVGPGLGPIIGPAGNFAGLSDAAKWALSAGMVLGRLELVTILVFLSPAFWRH